MITINFTKAVEITKDRLRQERKPLMTEQDVLFQRALENNANTSEIIKEKQRLRDITLLAEKAKTIDELKNLTAKPKTA